jgi:hypothetical protein
MRATLATGPTLVVKHGRVVIDHADAIWIGRRIAMRIEPSTADLNQYGPGMEPAFNEHLVKCTELVDGFGSTETISNLEKHMVVASVDQKRGVCPRVFGKAQILS